MCVTEAARACPNSLKPNWKRKLYCSKWYCKIHWTMYVSVPEWGYFKWKMWGLGKAQWLRTLASLAEYSAPFPDTHKAQPLDPVVRCSGLSSHAHVCLYTATERTFIQTHSSHWEELLILSCRCILFQKLPLSESSFSFLLKIKSHHKRVFTGFSISAATAR